MTTTLTTSAPVAAQHVARSSGMRERFGTVVQDLLDTDERLALVLADISLQFLGDAPGRHPDRVVNVGIREQLLVSVAGGMALTGLRPVVHTITPFLLERPFEQVKLDLGHQDVGAVLVSVGASYDVSAGGTTHHGHRDVALLDTLEGWTVHVPGHADEVVALRRQAAAGTGRVYLRLAEDGNDRAYDVSHPGAHVLRRGGRGTVVAVGPMLRPTLAAVADLDVTVLYLATVRPFDAATLRATLGRPDVVLVEPYLAGTSTGEVSRALADTPHRVIGLGVGREDLRRYGDRSDHAAAHGLDPAGIRRSISRFLAP